MVVEDIRDMVDDNGRMNYRQLVEYIVTYPLIYFSQQVRHPFLVGQDLYEGELTQNYNNTLRFRLSSQEMRRVREGEPPPPPSADANKPDRSAISHAIYTLRKKQFTTTLPNVISIGRSSDNDIVIADYVISKNHAQIILFHGLYFIVDVGSTNGTRVDGHLIAPNVKIKIDVNTKIAFGRLIFVFTSAADLYNGLRQRHA